MTSHLGVNELLEQHFDTAFAAPGGIKKLRELILTLAMQGKLVEQDPSDPPASELLKAIEAEKQQLHTTSSSRRRGSSAGKNLDSRLRGNDGIKIKSLPPIKPEEVPYELPQGWEWTRFSDLVEVLNGRAYKANELLSEGTPVVRVGNLFTSKKWYYSNLELDEDKYIDNGDLIYAWSASFGPFIWNGDRVIYHYHIWKLKFHSEGKPLKEFLYRYLHEKTDEIRRSGSGIAMIHMTKERMEKLLVPLPPLLEQHRIVAKIDQLMSKFDELEKLRKERQEKRLVVHAAAVKQLLDNLLSFPRRRESSSTEELDLHYLSARGQVCEEDEKGLAGDGVPVSGWDFIQQHFGELYTVKENVTELRKAILQLAVMGRLVPQDPNDPPASELLKTIEAEKQRLHATSSLRRHGSSEGKNLDSRLRGNDGIKIKSLPPIKTEEVPYELPLGWEWVTLEDVGYFFGGKTPSKNKPQYWGGNIAWVSPKDMKLFEIQDSEDHVTIAGVDSGLALIPEQSILMVVRSGILRRKFPVALNRIVCTINQDIKALVPFKSGYSNYLLLMLRGFEQFILEKLTKQGVTVESVKFDEFATTKFPLPPLPEQRRIVAKIDQLMILCDKLEQQIDAATGKQTELLNAVMAQV